MTKKGETMDINYQVKQEARLVMTTNLRLGIDLLAMNYLELNKKINDLALENVFLEFTPRESLYSHMTDFSKNRLDDRNPILSLVNEESLYDKIKKEIKLDLDPESYLLASYILNKIDDRGILTVSQASIKEKLNINQESLDRVLKKIRTFEPEGLAYSSIEDYLKSQTKDEDLIYLIDNHLLDLGENKIPHIAKQMKIDRKRVNELLEELKKLKPYPLFGCDLFIKKTEYISPDIVVKVKDSSIEFQVLAHERDIVISPSYLKMMEEAEGESKEYLIKKFRQADFIKKSLEERRINTEKVMNFLLDRQMDFFLSQGRLKSLTRKEVAEEVGLSSSTVSRIVKDKYLVCDRGLYPLKYFFIEGTEKNDLNFSRDYIEDRIFKLIQEEDKSYPLSDESLKKQLNKEGIEIQRRTVAKYRKSLGLGSSRDRRVFD